MNALSLARVLVGRLFFAGHSVAARSRADVPVCSRLRTLPAWGHFLKTLLGSSRLLASLFRRLRSPPAALPITLATFCRCSQPASQPSPIISQPYRYHHHHHLPSASSSLPPPASASAAAARGSRLPLPSRLGAECRPCDVVPLAVSIGRRRMLSRF